MFNSFHKLSSKENLFHDIFIKDKQIRALHNLVLSELVYMNSNILTRSPLYTNNGIFMKNFKTKIQKKTCKTYSHLFQPLPLYLMSSAGPVLQKKH